MSRLIDADALSAKMYHEAFETDSDMQKWDSGCWIRYKMFENAIESAPTIEPEPCEDAVSREDAIDTLDDEITITGKSNAYVVMDYVQRVKRKIENLPSVTPERKTGKWIEQDDGWDGVYYECSCCKEAFTLIDGTPSDNLYNYCPNCGSDMRTR